MGNASVEAPSPSKKLGLGAVVGIIFFTVSGGAYGLEVLVGTVGAFWALVLVILLPIFWAVPIGLMVAELASAIPENGGYYIWVKRACGDFWGFQEGWWTLCYSVANMAIFPVFFVEYLSYFFPQLRDPSLQMLAVRGLISLAFVLLSLWFNLRGSKTVGANAAANLLLVLFPFIAMSIWGLFKGDWANLALATTMPNHGWIQPSALAAGLAVVIWNYSGWESIATCASEVENPQKNFPRALAISLTIIILSYVLPLLAGFKVSITPSHWGDSSGWPSIAERLGGSWLGWSGAIAALLSVWALYNSQLLCVSYLPSVMAKDGWLPKGISKTSEKTGAPYNALFLISAVTALMSVLSLQKLIVVDMLFYALGLALEFMALITFRETHPNLPRPFRIRLPVWGLVLMSLPPLAIILCVATFSTIGESGSLIQLGIVAFGILARLGIYQNKRRSISESLLESEVRFA